MEQQQQEVKMTLRLPASVAEALRHLAEEHERSLNGEIIWALKAYIQEQESKKDKNKGEQ